MQYDPDEADWIGRRTVEPAGQGAWHRHRQRCGWHASCPTADVGRVDRPATEHGSLQHAAGAREVALPPNGRIQMPDAHRERARPTGWAKGAQHHREPTRPPASLNLQAKKLGVLREGEQRTAAVCFSPSAEGLVRHDMARAAAIYVPTCRHAGRLRRRRRSKACITYSDLHGKHTASPPPGPTAIRSQPAGCGAAWKRSCPTSVDAPTAWILRKADVRRLGEPPCRQP